MKQLICIVMALSTGCSPHMTKVGVGVGVGIAVVGCVPLVTEGDGQMGPPMLAATGAVVGGAVVLGSLIGYAIGNAAPPVNE